jgi:hypothetical protein
MKQKSLLQRSIILNCFLLVLMLAAPTAGAANVMMDMTVTSLGGGVYHYDVEITTLGPEEFAVVSITDGPPGDPLIDSSLTAPSGFLSSYDFGLGFIDFLADTGSFAPGSVVSGFSFESLAAPPNYLTSFQALDLTGVLSTGAINIRTSAVPDAGGTWPLAGLAFLALAFGQRPFKRAATLSH